MDGAMILIPVAAIVALIAAFVLTLSILRPRPATNAWWKYPTPCGRVPAPT